jgi:glycosyltransferase involved in cell wall biosynthesis
MTGSRPAFPQRVLLTTDTVGGVWTYTLELAATLEREGVEIVLASLGALPRSEQIAEARAIPGLELYALECRLPWMDDPWDEVAAAGDWLRSIARDTGADLVHLSEPVFGALEWRVPTVAVGHSCVLSWWEMVLGESAPPAWETYRQAMRKGLAGVNGVVAPSRWMLRALRQLYGVKGGSVIPNGRDPDSFRPGPKEPLVLTATRVWDPAKNALALDRAADGLAWPVYAAGEARRPGGGEAVAPAHLRMLGRLPPPELAGWLGRAAVFALPARYEPFGLSVLEAALAGSALVLGDIPSLRETWDGVAIFVAPDDHATLRLALEALILDPQLRQTLAMRARRRALGLTSRRMALAYLDLYRRLSPAGRRASPTGAGACAS